MSSRFIHSYAGDRISFHLKPELCFIIYMLSHLVMSNSVTPWTVACQAPLSKGFSRQEYWSTLSFPSLYYMYVPHFVYLFICWWKVGLLPSFTYCVNAAINMNVQKSVHASYPFAETPRSGIARCSGNSTFNFLKTPYYLS